ncbi:hypothetical protein NE237_016577 [Protea cynaroides]|uniref:Uncharacterized protein n=1 Tax=Protea cynaroides TaxID=273540 RepID=A0A9Q0K726_9MAGN|nr:hypothetical protein NE237_016577 [Protea cynaroides]
MNRMAMGSLTGSDSEEGAIAMVVQSGSPVLLSVANGGGQHGSSSVVVVLEEGQCSPSVGGLVVSGAQGAPQFPRRQAGAEPLGDVGRVVKVTLPEIAEVDALLQEDQETIEIVGINNSLKAVEVEVVKGLQKAQALQEKIWHENLKVRWFICRDMNSMFFHSYAKAKSGRCAIHLLLCDYSSFFGGSLSGEGFYGAV